MSVNGPIFFLFERFDFAFTLNDETKCDRLYTARRQSPTDFVPEQRRNLIAHKAVKDAPRLLRIHEGAVNSSRMFESFLNCTLGDLVKSHAADAFFTGNLFLALLLF